MADRPEYGRPGSEEERLALAEILGRSFSFPAAKARERFDTVGMENLRVFRDRGTISAGLWLVPMGQWFGGKSVPMTGIAAVGVAPEHRGRGAGLALMQGAIRELYEREIHLSTLYPAAQTLYRKAGYEQAGTRFVGKVAPKDIGIRDRTLPIRPATGDDRDAVKELYRIHARRLDGHLDRGPYVWDRVFQVRDEPAVGFVVEEEGRITGHVSYVQKPRETGGYELQVTDLTAITPAAGRRLLTFLADHRSMVPEVSWPGGPGDPLLTLFPEQPYTIGLQMIWMMRVVSVKGSLEARGYATAVRAEIHLEVRDELLPANTGRFVLEVAGGEGRVRPGGDGTLALDIRGLAALYTGFLSPSNLAAADLIRGDPPALRDAEAVFSGPSPWMPDSF